MYLTLFHFCFRAVLLSLSYYRDLSKGLDSFRNDPELKASHPPVSRHVATQVVACLADEMEQLFPLLPCWSEQESIEKVDLWNSA